MTKHDDLKTALAAVEPARAAAQAEYDLQASALAAATAEIARLNAIIAGGTPPPPPPTGNPPLPAGWTKELWADYFTGTAIDPKWNVRNNTTQSNMDGWNVASACKVHDGMLSIGSGPSGRTDKPWLCGYLDTNGKSGFAMGRWEARMRVPWGAAATGYWPAFWLRPADGGDGEIDIMEAWPSKNSLHQTTHHDYLSGAAHVPFQEGPQVASKIPGFDPTAWHVYAVEKEMGKPLNYYVDGVLIFASDPSWRAAIFDNARTWNIRLNLQMGGSWGGKPTAATDLTKTFDIDYVRVLGR